MATGIDSYNIVTRRGDSWQGLTLTVANSSTAVNLSAASILMQVKTSSNESIAVLEFSTTNGEIIIDNAATGSFYIAAQDAINVAPKIYVYDIEISNTILGANKTILDGTFTVEQDVSRI